MTCLEINFQATKYILLSKPRYCPFLQTLWKLVIQVVLLTSNEHFMKIEYISYIRDVTV